MSKFAIMLSRLTKRQYLTIDGGFACHLDDSDLADLVSVAQAALAEQNSRVMGGANVLTLGDLLKKAMEAGWTENGPPTQSTDQEGK